MKNIGIYKIINENNYKIYIGSTSVSFNKRWLSHKCLLNKNKHPNNLLQNSWNKHGENSFNFEIIEIVSSKNDILEKEQYYLDFYKSYENAIGYNLCKIAGSTTGRFLSNETKLKISLKNTGLTRSEGFKNNISKINKNNKYNIGRIISDETKNKLSKANSGRVVSDITKNKISESKMGHIVSDETKIKLSLFNIGKHGTKHTDTYKNKISGSGNPNSKLNYEEREKIIELFLNDNLSKAEISRIFKVSYCTIRNVINKKEKKKR